MAWEYPPPLEVGHRIVGSDGVEGGGVGGGRGVTGRGVLGTPVGAVDVKAACIQAEAGEEAISVTKEKWWQRTMAEGSSSGAGEEDK
jgi:hypothetical protein